MTKQRKPEAAEVKLAVFPQLGPPGIYLNPAARDKLMAYVESSLPAATRDEIVAAVDQIHGNLVNWAYDSALTNRKNVVPILRDLEDLHKGLQRVRESLAKFDETDGLALAIDHWRRSSVLEGTGKIWNVEGALVDLKASAGKVAEWVEEYFRLARPKRPRGKPIHQGDLRRSCAIEVIRSCRAHRLPEACVGSIVGLVLVETGIGAPVRFSRFMQEVKRAAASDEIRPSPYRLR